MPGFWIIVGVLLVLTVVGWWWTMSRRRKGSDDPAWRDRPSPENGFPGTGNG